MASVERTAYPRFKRTITSRELHEAFTPGPSEVAWARSKARSPEHLLALVVLLKSFQKLGYFPGLDEVPELVVGHVRGLLGLDEDMRPRHDADRTLRHHRTIIRERLGVEYDKAKAREIASAAIYEAVQTKDNPADLINVALERLELPGYTTLDAMASEIRSEVNTRFFEMIASRIDDVDTARVLELLRVMPGSRSRFDELKRPAKAPSVSHLREHLTPPGQAGAARADGEMAGGHPAGEGGALRRAGAGAGRCRTGQGRRGQAVCAAGERAAHGEGAREGRAGDDAVQADGADRQEGQGGPGEDP
ncbi:DUF4158 domain-containing protein [Streptomyces sp. ET3-23]|uniref:DUF4158 domain-containing protein n=1 Tax=Streptomyces sp. ET3-23 TaxID=2885643 RepID=UPI001D10C77D|nr:DUF4158 domain-containing protein [Streptomyces sp. ET3-23]MCC2280856.1 DUF4158 domain-containing protein [Streptomyces sp. ET3-23]